MTDRRKFIQQSALLLAGSSMTSLFQCSPSMEQSTQATRQFGIQLYTLRDIIADDFKGLLSNLASFGYTQIESFEGAQGFLWGMETEACKAYMDELGLSMVSTHCDINKDFEQKAETAAKMGMKYLVCPYVGPQESIDDFKRLADTFNEKGKICKENGLRFAYHNHDYSFRELDGEIPQSVMMEITDPELVDFELDMYWAVAAGEDPLAWMEKHPGRFKLSHIKDRSKEPFGDKGQQSVDLGTGIIDYRTIAPKALELGMEYLVVEQEYYPNGSSLEAARVDANFMKSI